MDDSVVQPAQKVDPLLAVGLSRILTGDDWMIEDCFAVLEVQPVITKVGAPFALIPGDHCLSVATKSVGSKVSQAPRSPRSSGRLTFQNISSGEPQAARAAPSRNRTASLWSPASG